jgi:lysophospholipase L1-like esterase
MKKAIFKNARYILSILLIYLVICEIFLRIFWKPADRIQPSSLQNPYLSPRIRYLLNEKDKRTYFAGGENTILKTNNKFVSRWLFQESMKKPDNIYRIFFIGGSTVRQAYIPKEKTSWGIIEDFLNKHSKNIRFECVNFGSNGAFIEDSVALVAHEIIHYDPDMIVVMHAVNDLYVGLTDPKLLISSVERKYLRRTSISRRLYRNSYLLMFLKRKIYDRLRSAFYLKPPEARLKEVRAIWKRAPKRAYATFPSLDSFRKNIKSLIGIAKMHNIRICFMTQPSLYSENMTEEEMNILWYTAGGTIPDIPTLYRGMNLYNEEVKRICEQHNIECIDLASKIPKNPRYFVDQAHYTPEGAKLVAGVVGDYLIVNRDDSYAERRPVSKQGE